MSRYLNSPREADWYACPSCGDEVRVGSSGCQRCSARGPLTDLDAGDDETDLSGLPDAPEDFDYNDWKKREFGSSVASRLKPHHLPWKYWITGMLLVLSLLLGALFLHH